MGELFFFWVLLYLCSVLRGIKRCMSLQLFDKVFLRVDVKLISFFDIWLSFLKLRFSIFDFRSSVFELRFSTFGISISTFNCWPWTFDLWYSICDFRISDCEFRFLTFVLQPSSVKTQMYKDFPSLLPIFIDILCMVEHSTGEIPIPCLYYILNHSDLCICLNHTRIFLCVA